MEAIICRNDFQLRHVISCSWCFLVRKLFSCGVEQVVKCRRWVIPCVCAYVGAVCSEVSVGWLFEFLQVVRKMELVLGHCRATSWLVWSDALVVCSHCRLGYL